MPRFWGACKCNALKNRSVSLPSKQRVAGSNPAGIANIFGFPTPQHWQKFGSKCDPGAIDTLSLCDVDRYQRFSNLSIHIFPSVRDQRRGSSPRNLSCAGCAYERTRAAKVKERSEDLCIDIVFGHTIRIGSRKDCPPKRQQQKISRWSQMSQAPQRISGPVL